MGIKKIQITRKMEQIIKSYLFRGRYPTFQTITHHFSEWLREHSPGAPSFNPLKVFRKEKSDAEKYNRHIEQIHQDIQDGYQATIEQSTQVMNDFNFLETERGKIHHEIAGISKTIDELLLMTNNTDRQYFNSYVVSFEDLKDINKEKSTAFVNVKNREATLMENYSSSSRISINMQKVMFQTLQSSTKHSALESIQNAFDDNMNTAWWHVVKSKELTPNMKAELIILFDQEEEINHIEYVPHHGNPVMIKLEYTLNGSSFIPIHQKASSDKVTEAKIWNFQKIRAKGIKFVFEKTDHDERSNNLYQYYFGAKQISIHKKKYLPHATLYTNPIIFDKDVREISMHAKNDVPFNSHLRYEIAMHQKDKSLEELIWHPISSFHESKPKFAKIVNLNMKEIQRIEVSQSEFTGQTINGMKVFRLMKDNGEGIVSEKILDTEVGTKQETFDTFQKPKLFRGINQWKRERCYVPFNGSIPLNSQWDELYQYRPELIRTNYIIKGNTLDLRRSGGMNDNFYRFSICVYSEEPKTESLSLSMISTLSTGIRKRLGAYAVYLNRQRLASVNDEVTMKLIKGWNEIQILYHWGDMQERRDIHQSHLPVETHVGKFNFHKESKVRADFLPMEHVDTHSLYHNISPNNRNYFAIHERQVVLNYLPDQCSFQLVYETNKQLEKHNEIVVRAIMDRDTHVPHITPKIYSLRIRAK